MISVNKRTREGGVVIKQLRERHNALKELSQGVTIQVLAQLEEVEGLKQSLKKAHDILRGLKSSSLCLRMKS